MSGSENESHRLIEAHNVLRYVPVVYLVSPSSGKQLAVLLHKGLTAVDAQDLASRSIEDHFSDSPLDILHELRIASQIDHATDWRFMTSDEIESFQMRTPPFFDGSVWSGDSEIEEGD